MLFSLIKQRIPGRFKREVRRALQDTWQSPLYRLSKRYPVNGRVRHIVFVCQGNVCRSAFAEHWLRSRIPGDALKVESCGLDVDRSTPPPAQASEVSRELGIDLGSHRSKGLESCDLENSDLIIAMVYNQRDRLISMHPEYSSKTLLLRTFAPFPDNLVCNIHDPFGLDHNEFMRCFRLMQRCLEGLVYRFDPLIKPD
jgi:protein-tyrosine phosphatase